MLATQSGSEDADKLAEEARESIHKVRDLVDELKTVQEHENAVLEDDQKSEEN